jgi:serine/threonine protein kinase
MSNDFESTPARPRAADPLVKPARAAGQLTRDRPVYSTSAMPDGDNRATQAWSRMETQFAATRATTSSLQPAFVPAPDPLRRSVSVLPVVESNGGDIRLVHDPRDRYRSQGVIGEGGMGVVERAEDIDIGRPVAIKRLLPEASHPIGVARFVGEVRIVGSLEHPNVAPIHDVGLDEQGRYFFVMKYVEGETLADVIDRLASGSPDAHAAWTFERRAEVMISVLRALEYAHARGIVHRDIKPDNIMIGRYGEVWLMDWGIAKKIGEAEPGVPLSAGPGMTGLIGTPAYMSPEQARGDEADVRSDLYAVAVTLHELVGLRHYLAHKSDDMAVMLGAIQHDPPNARYVSDYKSPHQGPPPVELRIVCERGLQKDPAQRFQSAADMLAGIQAFLEGRGEVHCMHSLTKRSLRESSRFFDRHPRVTILLLLTFFALAVAGLASFVGAVVA